jgi:hypothetical protein
MTTRSTPGPWTWDGKFTVGIPHVDGDTFFRTNPEDARLIVAAPELLAELKDAAQTARTYYGMFHDERWGARLAKWDAAIAKAEGR